RDGGSCSIDDVVIHIIPAGLILVALPPRPVGGDDGVEPDDPRRAAVEAVGAWWAAVPVAMLLFLLPAVFNTPGDKKTTGVPTPGRVRICIEALLLAAAVYGAWRVWPPSFAIAVTACGALMIVFGIPRYHWLLRGAPLRGLENQ
ncbi:MAG: hypothetical protein AAF721_04000, partial [Myxococcota bacterium]